MTKATRARCKNRTDFCGPQSLELRKGVNNFFTVTLSSYQMGFRIGFKVTVGQVEMRQTQHHVCRSSCFRRENLGESSQTRARSSSKRVRNYNCTHDANTLHRSETNGFVERAVTRVTEGTATAMVHRGLPEEWRDCAMECYCFLRDVHDKMAAGNTAYEKDVVCNSTDQ